MDKNKIYQIFFEQMNEALEWMPTEDRPYVVAAYIEGAACAVSRMLEAVPAEVGGYHISLTGEQGIKFSDEWRKGVVDA